MFFSISVVIAITHNIPNFFIKPIAPFLLDKFFCMNAEQMPVI